MPNYFNNRWKNVFLSQSGECAYCGIDLTSSLDVYHSSTEDHMVPQSDRGASGTDNLVAACSLCNSLKDDDYPPGFSPTSGVVETGRTGFDKDRRSTGSTLKIDDVRREEFFIAARNMIAKAYAKRIMVLKNELAKMGRSAVEFDLSLRPKIKDLVRIELDRLDQDTGGNQTC